MFTIKNPKQKELIDPWHKIGKKRRKVLEESWAGLFQKEILPELPVRQLSYCFDDQQGRPSKELYTIIGLLILQQMHDMTDEETFNNMLFNTQWHYALNIVSESDDAKFISLKTIWNMRHLIIEKGLDKVIFDRIAIKLKDVFSVDFSKQRLDSVHIKSNMKKIGRIRIFYTTIHKFLINLKRKNITFFDQVKEEIRSKYTSEKSMQCFAMVKPSESSTTLKTLSKDLYALIEQFKDNDEIKNMFTYKNLIRVLQEQCTVSEDDSQVEIKKPKDVPSNSLQNPSDPDATYSGHKGQGYSVQICETYTKDKDSSHLNLITHVSADSAHKSDVNFTGSVIEDTKKKGLLPDLLTADTLYGSDENSREAKDSGVDLLAPVSGPINSDNHTIADFVTSDDSDKEADPNCSESSKETTPSLWEEAFGITKCKDSDAIICPAGHKSCRYRKTKKFNVYYFDSNICNSCNYRDKCPVKPGKKKYTLSFTDKAMRIATRRKFCKSEEFKEEYRYRAGIEGTISQYDRKTGVKQLRIRGIKAVRFCVTLKAAAINIFRATAVSKTLEKLKNRDNSTGLDSVFGNISVLISNILKIKIKTTNILSYFVESPDYGFKWAA